MQHGPYNQQPPPQAQPQGWQQQPPMQAPQPQAQEQKKPGCLMPGIWLGIAAVITLISLAYVGFAAYHSESAGVRAAQIVAIPFGFAWGGFISALLIQLAYKKASKGVRIGGPIGCGCLGAFIVIFLIFIFFAAIFPAL